MINVNATFKVSIIMPTYNRAAYIVEAIESIRSQTYQNWELIIVDDGSDDNTEEVICKINDERIGLYKAGRIGINGKIKNIGLEKVSGELIAFIDSDDLWAPTKLEKQVAALHQYPEAGFSLTGGYNFRKLNEPIDFFYEQTEGMRCDDIFISFFKSEISGTTPSLMLRKQCMNVIGSFEEVKPFSDIDFILNLAGHFKAVILYEPLLYRRLHDTNDSSSNWEKGYYEGIAMIKSYKKNLPKTIVRDALVRLYINFGEDCLLHKERWKAVNNFFFAWKNKPFSVVPFKKTGKSILRWLKKNNSISNMAEQSVNINIPAKPWTKSKPPERILAIRLQAMGDLAAALPYLQDLRNSFPPSVRLDLLTREEVEDIPRNILLFNKVFSIGGGRNLKKQLVSTFFLLPKLLIQRYDVVIDLQNNIISEIVRKTLLPKAWSVFDRFSPVAGGECYRLTIEAAGIGKNKAGNNFRLKYPGTGKAILKKNGWQQQNELVVLNPAAAFETRNWNIHNYVSFAILWLNEFPQTQFLVIGTSFIASKADFLKEQLGEKLINLVNKTTPSEAFAILQQVKLVLSEDSGLMHMAWGSGIPTMGLFGATRTVRARPLGEHTFFLDSSDLPCGGCMKETCKFGDVHCLTRYTPEHVFYHAFSLVQKLQTRQKIIIE